MGFIHSLLQMFRSHSNGTQQNDLVSLQNLLDYSFHDIGLLEIAVTHPSALQHDDPRTDSYERLEFLGDSVLDLVVSEYLYQSFAEALEGDLSQRRAQLVNQKTLADIGRTIGLPGFIRSQSVHDRPLEDSDAVVSDVVEAILGAIYLDGGLGAVQEVISHIVYVPQQDSKWQAPNASDNYKGKLIEYCHEMELDSPIFKTINITGPDHASTYTVAVMISGEKISTGRASSKKEAGQNAAKYALAQLNQ